ncbi:hypothetical protein [Yersinia intermedia]|uniref:hypothetical protein n=1 Tax=Yersinia intermedia TaxID=631 RepID=UPI001F532A51|nr:hypothetical protein [Yersinia intermedia]UNK21791.1 hypothetical protein MNQ97_13200 [Yersinia intermedia]
MSKNIRLSTCCLCFSLLSGSIGLTHSVMADSQVITPPQNLGMLELKECGKGYVVGVWSSSHMSTDWVVWLSPSGQSWSNKDKKAYYADINFQLSTAQGMAAFNTVKLASSTGQMVAFMSDNSSGKCSIANVNGTAFTVFNSVQAWYP